MIMRDASLNGYLLNVRQLWRVSGSYLVYKMGESLIRFIAEEYGEEKLILIMENWWKSERFYEVLEMSLGETTEVLTRKWHASLKRRYFPVYDQGSEVGLASTQMTFKGPANLKPILYRHPDGGTKFVFMSFRAGYPSIYSFDWDKSDDHMRQQIDSKAKLVIRGGAKEGFESLHFFTSRNDIDSKGRLLFSSKSGGRDIIYVWNIPENREEKRFEYRDIVAISSPTWSNDGRRVVFSGLDNNGRSDLFLLELETGVLTRLTDDHFEDIDPDWSPVSDQIVFASDRNRYGMQGKYNLHVLKLSDRSIRPLTYGPFNDLSPRFSPDGRMVAVSSDHDGRFNIHLVDMQGRRVPVTNILSGAFDPVFSPDGGTLFYTVLSRLRYQIYASDLPALYDPEEGDPLPETAEKWSPSMAQTQYEVRPYRMKFSLDVVSTALSTTPTSDYGTGGASQLVFTDMLNDHLLLVTLFNSAREAGDIIDNFSFGFTYINQSSRLNYGFGLFRYIYDDITFARYYYSERAYGGMLLLSYPLSLFRRIDTDIGFSKSNRGEWLSWRASREWLLTHNISYIMDNSLWGEEGPIDGHRFNFSVGESYNLEKFGFDNLRFYNDFRYYMRLTPRSSLAWRIITATSRGSRPEYLYLGGSFSLRGYRIRHMRGQNIFLLNNELRFPLLDSLVLGLPFGRVEFPGLRGALFLDAGNAWFDYEYSNDGLVEGLPDAMRNLRGSLGVGVRLNLGNIVVLRLDWARRTDFKRFSKNIVSQFFIGWSY
jgi:hypothetical protein